MNRGDLMQSNQWSRIAHLLSADENVRARIARIITNKALSAGSCAVLTSDSSHTTRAAGEAGVTPIGVAEPLVLLCAVKNPMTSEIDRAIDELVRLCRIAGALEADLVIRGKKRKAKTELDRIDRIVRDARQHLIGGINTIRCRCGLEGPSQPLSCPDGV